MSTHVLESPSPQYIPCCLYIVRYLAHWCYYWCHELCFVNSMMTIYQHHHMFPTRQLLHCFVNYDLLFLHEFIKFWCICCLLFSSLTVSFSWYHHWSRSSVFVGLREILNTEKQLRLESLKAIKDITQSRVLKYDITVEMIKQIARQLRISILLIPRRSDFVQLFRPQ